MGNGNTEKEEAVKIFMRANSKISTKEKASDLVLRNL